MIFLSSPYSHPDPAVREQRYVAACKAAAWLMLNNAWGYMVFSPIAHSHGIALYGGLAVDVETWWKLDEAMLFRSYCLVVLTLDGWRESVGVQKEIGAAKGFSVSIWYLDPETLYVSEKPLKSVSNTTTSRSFPTTCRGKTAFSLFNLLQAYPGITIADAAKNLARGVAYTRSIAQEFGFTIDQEGATKVGNCRLYLGEITQGPLDTAGGNASM